MGRSLRVSVAILVFACLCYLHSVTYLTQQAKTAQIGESIHIGSAIGRSRSQIRNGSLSESLSAHAHEAVSFLREVDQCSQEGCGHTGPPPPAELVRSETTASHEPVRDKPGDIQKTWKSFEGVPGGKAPVQAEVPTSQTLRRPSKVEVLTDPVNLVGRAYDFSCRESQKHKCACQLECKGGGSCKNAVELCKKTVGCIIVVLNRERTWATLKRAPNQKELDLLDIPDRDMTWSQFNAMADSMPPPLGASKMHPLSSAASLVLNASSAAPPSPLCGAPSTDPATDMGLLLEKSLGIIALSFKSTATLRNSMNTWNSSGLLGLASERIALLNAPRPIDAATAVQHGFEIIQPKDMKGRVEMNGKNVLTIGSAFYHGLLASTSDYVLFLEKDFKADTELSLDAIKEELLGSLWMLERGVAIVRLRSSKEMGCGTFRNCENDGNMPNWKGKSTMQRRRNWWSFYCREAGRAGAKKAGVDIDSRVAECLGKPGSGKPVLRCFTSWDSNWTLNAVLVNRKAMLERRFKFDDGRDFGTLAAYGKKFPKQQDGFEVGLLKDDWGRLRVPMCLGVQGIFIHEEIDG